GTELDTHSLLLVSGLFNSGGGACAGASRPGGGRVPRRAIEGHAVQALEIIHHALIEPFSEALAVLALFQKQLIGGIAEERNLSEDRRHIRAEQDHERCAANPAVLHVSGGTLNAMGQRVLNVLGKLAGFLTFFVARELLPPLLTV